MPTKVRLSEVRSAIQVAFGLIITVCVKERGVNWPPRSTCGPTKVRFPGWIGNPGLCGLWVTVRCEWTCNNCVGGYDGSSSAMDGLAVVRRFAYGL